MARRIYSLKVWCLQKEISQLRNGFLIRHGSLHVGSWWACALKNINKVPELSYNNHKYPNIRVLLIVSTTYSLPSLL